MNLMNIKNTMTGLGSKTSVGVSLGVAVALLVAGYAVFGKEEGHAAAPKAEAPVPVSAYIVESRTIESIVTAAGALTSRNTSVLSSKVIGRVSYLGVQEGDHVSSGKLLIKIESGEIAAQTFQAQAAYNNAKLQYDRIKGLYGAKASTQVEMDQATLGIETAKAGLNAAKAMESYTTITAPIAGQIMEKRINLGEMAMPGQPLFKIEDNQNLRLEVTVREQDILHIRPGSTVNVQIDAIPEKPIHGKVAMVVPASDVRTHSFVVKVDIPAAKGLITGMYGKAFFPTGKREAIVVPKSAVVEMSGISGVYVVSTEGNAVFQMIQPGEVIGNELEVVSGLKKGDQIIADKHLGRIEGRKVILAKNNN
jgi:RND family efflux transporter MFP subunit